MASYPMPPPIDPRQRLGGQPPAIPATPAPAPTPSSVAPTPGAMDYPAPPPTPTTPPGLPVSLPNSPFSSAESTSIPGSSDVGFSGPGFQSSPAGPPSNDDELLQHILSSLAGRR